MDKEYVAKIDQVMLAMIDYYAGDPKRIQHFIKVYEFSRLIGQEERLEDSQQFILEVAALVHDIGIRPAEEKYGNCNGKLQEQEGPAPARELLQMIAKKDIVSGGDAVEERLMSEAVIDRVCYLVGHHHTYTNVDGMDYQILLEADFLVNLYEDHLPVSAVQNAVMNVFRTATGIQLARTMFLKN